MKIVFHGASAASYRNGVAARLDADHEIITLSEGLAAPGEAAAYASADVIIGARLAAAPSPSLRLFQLLGAGYDGIDRAALPPGAAFCNCYGHENAIAEYVMAAALQHFVPLAAADAELRRGDWSRRSGRHEALRGEMGSASLALTGFGHIGRAVAARAQAFGMRVSAANRSPVSAPGVTGFALGDIRQMLAGADIIVNTLPLTAETKGLIGAAELDVMRPGALIINTGRGGVIDEAALYEALARRRIGGAVIDVWYQYPDAQNPARMPSSLPFHELDNLVMTAHLSGWTHETIARRRDQVAENINRLAAGRDLLNRIG